MNHDPGSEERLLAKSYVTGHKPKETIEQMLVRINSNSFIGALPEHFGSNPDRGRKRKLTSQQESLVMEWLRGERQAIRWGTETFLYRPGEAGTLICSLDAEAREHEVVGDVCSCEDCRFRQHECKHIRALRSVT